MGQRFADVGVPEWTAQVWIASLLRDGFALTAAGATERFSTIAEWVLHSVLAGQTLSRNLDAAIEHIMSGFLELTVHPDVPNGVRALAAAVSLLGRKVPSQQACGHLQDLAHHRRNLLAVGVAR